MSDWPAHLRPVGADGAGGRDAAPEHPEDWDGVTAPSRRGGSTRFLTDVLVELGCCDRERVEAAIAESRSAGIAPEKLLLDQHAITQEQLSRAVAERYGLDHLDLGVFKVDMAAVNLLTASAAKRYGAVPVAYAGEDALVLAMSDPADMLAADDIALLTHLDVEPAVASAEDIQNLISRMNRFEDAVHEAVEEGEEGAGPMEVVDLRESAEDAPKRMVPGVISRIKIMSDLDISERRVPQDGRVGLTIDGRHVDVRVVTLPSVHGESVVLRILDKDNVQLDLHKLGMQELELERFRKAFHPDGAAPDAPDCYDRARPPPP
ncbi:MAG TPA: ATPase, T2SS/T4P/T4SS family [Solirubrobacteraceae bacterium]